MMPAIWIVLGVLVSVFTARIMNRRFLSSGLKPFAWGYYQSCILIVKAIAALWSYIYYTQNTYYSGPIDFLFLALIEVAIIVSSVLNFKRYRIGAIAVSVLNFNPVSCVINWIYYKNRWGELLKISKHKSVSRVSANMQIRRRPLTPPKLMQGKWSNIDYTIRIGKDFVNIYRHKNGIFLLPEELDETSDSKSYYIDYKDPSSSSMIGISFDLVGTDTMRFKIEQKGNIIEFGESLHRVPEQ